MMDIKTDDLWMMWGDCLERMKEIPSGSVDMVLTDPPYGTICGVAGGGVSHGMKGKTSWDETINKEIMFEECNRILRPNGALVLFSQEPYTSELINMNYSNIQFSYRYVWVKDHFANSLVAKKAPVNYFEDVCVFFKRYTKHDFEGFHPLRPYAERVMTFIGEGKRKIFTTMGHQGLCHFMRHGTSQFSMCTEKTYSELIAIYGIDKMEGFKDYDELKPIDAAYRADLIKRMTDNSPKVFNLPEGKKYKSNILEYRKDYTGHHPTQKPVALIADLIKTYTNIGDSVLDFTMGSGSTGVAARNLGRKFIGIELDPNYYGIALDRVLTTAP